MSVTVVEGDLLDQDVEVIVNAWNRNIIPWWLLIPQGVSGAIKRRAGTMPFRELGYRPLPLGAARVTGAGRLPHRAIIHVAGINMLWRSSVDGIRDCVTAAMAEAERLSCASIALPIIGAGSGGMSEDTALAVIMDTLRALEPTMRVVVVRFVR
ncbi:MAG: O-acetyl-ADP-ribose deacetylase (regulator of RNase III) [Myxococcota bacterium]|jgi:O-acetyl-ADP-ribose deacetylase (regulator of RNase III)